MTIELDKLARIEEIAPHLLEMSESMIDRAVDSGDILTDRQFDPRLERSFGQFYAPFDWANEEADIVLVGITPGKRQAKTALKALRRELAVGRTPTEAAYIAKQAASFDGDMRDIAAQLMDRFNLGRIFGLKGSKELFESARGRAHYTSLLRYPILHWQTRKKNGNKITGWFDYSGGEDIFDSHLLIRARENEFEREIVQFRKAWIVPFGPTPALALEQLARRGVLDQERILAGINHPSGTQWNRHNCQLNISDDHSRCAPNVGCSSLRERSRALERKVSLILTDRTESHSE